MCYITQSKNLIIGSPRCENLLSSARPDLVDVKFYSIKTRWCGKHK